MTIETKPPTRMTKQELVNILSKLGYVDEQLRTMKRPALLKKLKDHQYGEQGLIDLETIEEDNDDVGIVVQQNIEQESTSSKEKSEIPTPCHPEWTQYVLGKFLDDEIEGQNPRVEGLRRIASELVGELIEEGCDLITAPTEENRFRACAKAWGVFLTPKGITKRFEALADANSDNCFEDYATYLVSMADTRAKGRMFRNALGLRRVVAAEEINKTTAMAADIESGGPIHTGQISMIRLMAERNGLNIAKILDDLDIKYDLNKQNGDVNLQLLSYDDALAVAKKMRETRETKGVNND